VPDETVKVKGWATRGFRAWLSADALFSSFQRPVNDVDSDLCDRIGGDGVSRRERRLKRVG
jgi:hypothetical protein